MSRRLLFHRDFRGYTGGHGKVRDYFDHADAHPDWEARAFLTPDSVPGQNPWLRPPTSLEPEWRPHSADALFLAGNDWQAWPADDPARPVINLVQGLRHADPEDPLFAFLGRRAIRLCVSTPVADAILASGKVNGPVQVIPAALDLASLPSPSPSGERLAVFVGAAKNPPLGRALAAVLRDRGQDVRLLDDWEDREGYLAAMAACRIAVLLPLAREGFFLPALEAMALGCATVVPDCVGNGQYLRPGVNALVPEASADALAEAVQRLGDPTLADSVSREGLATAAQFGLPAERRAFHSVLDALGDLWAA